MIDHYAWRDAREAMLRFGSEDAPLVLIVPPLFEEANRTRHFLVAVTRGLAAHGIASILPDLPGMNDSPVATVDARLGHWGDALAALPAPAFSLSLRGGALLDGFVRTNHRWRLSPETGARLLRDMVRATAMSAGTTSAALEIAAGAKPTRLAGNLVHPELYAALNVAIPASEGVVRTARLEGDASPSDITLPGTPLWRRAEPDHDPALAAFVVSDIADWMTSCGIR